MVERPAIVGVAPEPIFGLFSRIDGEATFGMVLYPPVMLPDVPGRPLLLLGLLTGIRFHGSGSTVFSLFISSFTGDGVLFREASLARSFSLCTAIGVNSLSYVFGIAPDSAQRASCCFFAKVGISCWSGGSRGSGLYMVASQGGSPSGRFADVRGLSGSPDLVPGRWLGEGVARGGAETFRLTVAVFIGTMLLGDIVADFDLVFCGETALLDAIAEELVSLSSADLFLILGIFRSPSKLIVPLAVRFRAIGVSRSYRSAGIGRGLPVIMGILEPDFRNIGFAYICAAAAALSASISSGRRKSHELRLTSSSISAGESRRCLFSSRLSVSRRGSPPLFSLL